jgi:hypothetical protein
MIGRIAHDLRMMLAEDNRACACQVTRDRIEALCLIHYDALAASGWSGAPLDDIARLLGVARADRRPATPTHPQARRVVRR